MELLKTTTKRDLVRGWEPKLFYYLSATYVSAFATKFASSQTPTDLPPAVRGFIIGAISTPIEVLARNALNSIHTRRTQKQPFVDILKDGGRVWRNGFISALGHRGLSNVIFMGSYMPLFEILQNGPLTGTIVGMGIQVPLTAPLFITAVLRQAQLGPGEAPLPKSLWGLFKHIAKTKGVAKMFLPGLGLRLVHSGATSAVVSKLYEDNKVIHRKG
jgi:hypothetical protein